MLTRIIAAAALLASARVALAADVSYDQQRLRGERPALAERSAQADAKNDAPRAPATGCSCQHGRS